MIAYFLVVDFNKSLRQEANCHYVAWSVLFTLRKTRNLYHSHNLC
jgi:hypothetical protein